MREIRLDEEAITDTKQLEQTLQEQLQLPQAQPGSTPNLQRQLEAICDPTRIVVIRREWNRSQWFDQACTTLERASTNNYFLDVDVQGQQPDAIAQARQSPQAALERLRRGNAEYLQARHSAGNISQELIDQLFEEGQSPYATVLTCSDSRVVPEHAFMCGLGELFCIRTAGNVVGPSEMASAVYACSHLGTPLLVVMGHTHCGAIDAAMRGGQRGAVGTITARITEVIGAETDPLKAARLNVQEGVYRLCTQPELASLVSQGKLAIYGALYYTHSGKVEFWES
ncbi:MAG: carbonic anhydrase [Atopobiaceae bacterium]